MSSYGHYLKAALTSVPNIVVFSLLAVVSLVSMNPIPIVLGLVAEAAWLGIAPVLPAFRASVDKTAERHKEIDRKNAASDVIAQLPASAQQRYRRLEGMVDEVRSNYEKIGGNSRILLDQIGGQMESLLPRYLEMLRAASAFDATLEGTDEHDIDARIATLDAEIAGADPRVAEIKERQRGILEKRRDTLGRARKDTAVLHAQLEAFEDLARLLKEQSLTMRDPSAASAQIDALVSGIDVTEQTVHELESNYAELFDRELAAAQQKSIGS